MNLIFSFFSKQAFSLLTNYTLEILMPIFTIRTCFALFIIDIFNTVNMTFILTNLIKLLHKL